MKIFLSYSSEDRVIAERLALQLKKGGLDIWDPAEALFPGDNWALHIGNALQESDAMVVLVSPHSMKSQWVRQEFEFAMGSDRYKGRLIPVLVKPTKDMPWILKRFPMVKIGHDLTEAIRKISEHVKHGFELTPVSV